MSLFDNKYRIESIRRQDWDYGWNGYYFVTICTKVREPVFGEIIDGKMDMNNFGIIADTFWKTIPIHFPFVKLDEYIIMPDHVHGIIIIDIGQPVETRQCLVSTTTPMMVTPPGEKWFRNPGKQNLSSVIGSYKSIVTRTINMEYPGNTFAWQSRFYDRIIRE